MIKTYAANNRLSGSKNKRWKSNPAWMGGGALSWWVHQTDFRPCRYKSGWGDEPCQQNSSRYSAADTKHRTVCFRHDTFDYRRRGNLRFHRVFCPYDGHQTFSHEAVLYARHGDGMVGVCRKRDDDSISCSERYCPVVWLCLWPIANDCVFWPPPEDHDTHGGHSI